MSKYYSTVYTTDVFKNPRFFGPKCWFFSCIKKYFQPTIQTMWNSLDLPGHMYHLIGLESTRGQVRGETSPTSQTSLTRFRPSRASGVFPEDVASGSICISGISVWGGGYMSHVQDAIVHENHRKSREKR